VAADRPHWQLHPLPALYCWPCMQPPLIIPQCCPALDLARCMASGTWPCCLAVGPSQQAGPVTTPPGKSQSGSEQPLPPPASCPAPT
jgi:hypothetical protein